ncbi:phage holin family protein [Halanaerocella petrolearia]
MIRLMAIWFYISKEGISALENLGQVGVPIPNF